MYSFKRLSLPAAWLGALALMPAAASATVTQTSVTSPANKSNLLPLNTDMNVFSPFSELINVSGTAPGASDGDQLDVRCYNANGQFIPGPGTITVTVNNGKWTTADLFPFGAGFPISVGGPVKNAPASGGLGTMCNLRAVPAGTNPLDLRPYQPNAVGLGRLDTFDDSGLSGGPLKNYEAYPHQVGGNWKFSSAGDGGAADSRVNYGSNFANRDQGVFRGVATFGEAPLALGGAPTIGRTAFGDPSISVDNQEGGASQAAVLPFDQSGAPNGALNQSHVDVQRSVDADGNMTLVETSSLRRCHVVATQCTDYQNAGVKLTRAIKTARDGQQAIITDTWTNTDVDAHSITLRYHNTVGDARNAGVGVGDSVPKEHVAYDTVVPGTPGPWSLTINSDTNDPDVDGSDDHGAITYVNAPEVVLFENTNEFQSWYSRKLGPGESATITQVLSQAGTVAEARALAKGVEDAVNPPKPPAPPTPSAANNGGSSNTGANDGSGTIQVQGARHGISRRILRGKKGARYLRIRVTGKPGETGSVLLKVRMFSSSGSLLGTRILKAPVNRTITVRKGVSRRTRSITARELTA